MRVLYQHLFYNAYMDGKNSKNFSDVPVFYASAIVAFCLLANIGIICIMVERLLDVRLSIFVSTNRIEAAIIGTILISGTYMYYKYKQRYMKILNHYTSKKRNQKQISHLLIVICYLLISWGMLLGIAILLDR